MDGAVRRSGPHARRHPLLLSAAGASLLGAAVLDVTEPGHPVHLLGLGLVAALVWGAHAALTRSVSGGGFAVALALVAQPLLHLWAEAFDDSHTAGGGLEHVMVTDGRVTALQMVTSLVAVLIAGVGVRIMRILGSVLGRKSGVALLLPTVDRVVAAMTQSAISALHSCCWAVRTARRGPPVGVGN